MLGKRDCLIPGSFISLKRMFLVVLFHCFSDSLILSQISLRQQTSHRRFHFWRKTRHRILCVSSFSQLIKLKKGIFSESGNTPTSVVRFFSNSFSYIPKVYINLQIFFEKSLKLSAEPKPMTGCLRVTMAMIISHLLCGPYLWGEDREYGQGSFSHHFKMFNTTIFSKVSS